MTALKEAWLIQEDLLLYLKNTGVTPALAKVGNRGRQQAAQVCPTPQPRWSPRRLPGLPRLPRIHCIPDEHSWFQTDLQKTALAALVRTSCSSPLLPTVQVPNLLSPRPREQVTSSGRRRASLPGENSLQPQRCVWLRQAAKRAAL